jgi:putative N6-adenine-specific DNA methylase
VAEPAGAAKGDKGTKPPLTVYLRVRREKVTVSVDTSGEHLHRRGYRTHAGDAPLRENLAAACLLSLGYDGSKPLVDPCCGSGTFAVEAALIATNTAPGLLRGFAFERLPLFDPEGWEGLREEAEAARVLASAPIFSSDIDPEAVALAARAAQAAGVGESVQVAQLAMEELDDAEMESGGAKMEQGGGGFLIANPPYGLRLKGEARAYSALRRMIGGRFSSWRWGVIVCLKREAASFPVEGQQSLRFVGAGLPLEFRTGGAPE